MNPITKNVLNDNKGKLFVVATPIGNLKDFSPRAQKVLSSVSVILAEDTRHSKRLTNHFGITTRLKSCHEHNEAERVEWVIQQLEQGLDIALISDAGTPLISDPGFVLVRALREHGHAILAIPGPSAVIAALSIAGLPTDRFLFDGFLPAKSVARCKQLEEYQHQARTVVLFESSHRIEASLSDFQEVLGEHRSLVVAREISKQYETVLSGSIAEVLKAVKNDSQQTRGEFVMMLEGVPQVAKDVVEVTTLLSELLDDLPVKKAAIIVAKMTGWRKNDVYDLALKLKNEA